jgi:hypothetical protein
MDFGKLLETEHRRCPLCGDEAKQRLTVSYGVETGSEVKCEEIHFGYYCAPCHDDLYNAVSDMRRFMSAHVWFSCGD